MLTDEQRESFDRDGFLVLEGAVGLDACARLMARAEALVEAFEPETVSVFSTKDQARTTDDYFLSSGGEVRFFFEEEAFDDAGHLRQPKELSINKIGHAEHDLDPVFSEFSRQPAFAAIATDLGFTDPLLLQSMYIFKQPKIGGEVVNHQDATFLYTDPVTVTGFWVALQDATLENGCLWALPGGHKTTLRKRFAVNDDRTTRFDTLDPAPLPPSDDPAMVPLEAKAGTLVLLHGLLPHASGPNRSPRSRHAYSVHLIDGSADYPADNWLQRAADKPLRGF
ncbi:MAG: phytanoyl-CoA hydroxylase [Frankiales bacterium]|nr:phytanoyl-CoA hydroxylase [Frankiales bacterium]